MTCLNQQQIAQYHNEGFTVLEKALADTELAALRARVEGIASGSIPFKDECIEYEPDAPRQRHIDNLRKINNLAAQDPFFLDHACSSSLLGTAETLLGPDVKFFGDQLFAKGPSGIEKPYHQDSAYFQIKPMAILTAWIALEDSNVENGCLWVVPGSHREGLKDHSEVWLVCDRQDQRIPNGEIDRAREEPILLRAGDCSFHHSLLLHRSGHNQTRSRRCGLATHYMSACSRSTGTAEDKPSYPVLRGREYPGCV